MRPLVLYVRSRRIAGALTAAVGSTALLWSAGARLDDPEVARNLGPIAVGIAAAVAGHGLAGADSALERTAALDWRPRRAAHIGLVVAAALGIVAATTLTDHPLGAVAAIARNAIGAGGLLALAATLLGAAHAWSPPLLWTLAAPHALEQFWPTPRTPLSAQLLTWPAQPPASARP